MERKRKITGAKLLLSAFTSLILCAPLSGFAANACHTTGSCDSCSECCDDCAEAGGYSCMCEPTPKGQKRSNSSQQHNTPTSKSAPSSEVH